MVKPEEKAKELYFSVLNEGKGLLSDYLCKEITELIIDNLDNNSEEMFHKFGIGFMGSANARNDYTKHTLSKYWNNVRKELKNLQ